MSEGWNRLEPHLCEVAMYQICEEGLKVRYMTPCGGILEGLITKQRFEENFKKNFDERFEGDIHDADEYACQLIIYGALLESEIEFVPISPIKAIQR